MVPWLSGVIMHLCELKKGSHYCERQAGFPVDNSRTFCGDGGGHVAYLCCQHSSHWPQVASEKLEYG